MKKETFPLRLIIISLIIIGQQFIGTNTLHAFQNNLENYREYKGRVLDAESRRPLAFADISVPTTNLSTITNKEGRFSIKIPADYQGNIISISYLGYKTVSVNLKNLNNKTNTIILDPIFTALAEININAPKNAKALVKIALSNGSNRYVKNRTLMTAFYRETIKKRKTNASLTEAVVKIFKQPYNTSRNDEIELIKSRKNTNYSKLDTIALKLQGGPFSTLYADIVKYPEYIFTPDTFVYYDFDFSPTTEINNRAVYVVDFRQQQNIITPLYQGKLYIDSETFALISADYQLNVNNKSEAIKLFLKKKPKNVDVEPLTASYKVDYKMANNKWYYSYSNLKLTFKVKWPKKLFSKTYTLDIEMAVTDWILATKEKVNPKTRIRPSIILSNEASGFSDPEFWGKFNIIEPEKSIESAIRKISRQLSRLDK